MFTIYYQNNLTPSTTINETEWLPRNFNFVHRVRLMNGDITSEVLRQRQRAYKVVVLTAED